MVPIPRGASPGEVIGLEGASADGRHVFVVTKLQPRPPKTLTAAPGTSMRSAADRGRGCSRPAPLDAARGGAAFNSFSGASADGGRVFFSSISGPLLAGLGLLLVPVYERAGGVTNPVVFGPRPQDPLPPHLCHADSFDGVSADGSHLFFSTDRRPDRRGRRRRTTSTSGSEARSRVVTTYPERVGEIELRRHPATPTPRPTAAPSSFRPTSRSHPRTPTRPSTSMSAGRTGSFVAGLARHRRRARAAASAATGRSRSPPTARSRSSKRGRSSAPPITTPPTTSTGRPRTGRRRSCSAPGRPTRGRRRTVQGLPRLGDRRLRRRPHGRLRNQSAARRRGPRPLDGRLRQSRRDDGAGLDRARSGRARSRRGTPRPIGRRLDRPSSRRRGSWSGHDLDHDPDIYLRRAAADRTAPDLGRGDTAADAASRRTGGCWPPGRRLVRVACPKAETSGPCHGTVTLSRGRRRVGRAPFRIDAGGPWLGRGQAAAVPCPGRG